MAELQAERSVVEQARVYSVLQSLVNPRVLALSVIYLGIATAGVGLVIFLPQMIRQLGVSNLMTGFATSVPYIFGTVGMIICGYVTDRMHERRWNLVLHPPCRRSRDVRRRVAHGELLGACRHVGGDDRLLCA